MADLGGITGLLSAVVQRSVEVQQNADSNDADENRTTTETAGASQAAGAGASSATTPVERGLAFQPVDSTGTDQNTNTEANGAGGRIIVDQVTISDQARSALAEAQAGGTTSRSPAETLIEETTNPAANLAFRADSARDAATIDGTEEVEEATNSRQTNQVETNERDTGVVVGNTDITAFSAQNRELGQLVDQFA